MASRPFTGITNPRLREVVRDAIHRGWEVSWTGKQHIRLRHPSGAVVICSGTPRTDIAVYKTEKRLADIEAGR
ncbi:MAG TPA: hypothetical protein VIQ02_12430 [Jiangellaceae bacterium]